MNATTGCVKVCDVMSGALMRSECRKFAPNIFNKTKCTNCFRQKEEHSAEALESNRATRKVAKYGYLFVAPGWDFSNPLNRTKRWQRRWFVLFDDGELSYSVDEHPDTVPQASIDMNKVLEVADAEEVTGNAFSLAITAPDRVHFVKGTCRDEYRSWSDVLSVFPRSKGRHKRNATFPGGQSTSTHQPSQTIRVSTPQETRPRFNSCHSEHRQIHHTSNSNCWLQIKGVVYPTRDVCPLGTDIPPRVSTSAPVDAQKVYYDQPASSASPPTRDKIQSEEKARTRRVQNREKRGVRSGRSFSEDFSGLLPGWQESHRPPTDSQRSNDVARRILFDYEDESKRDEKLKDIADSITRPRFRRHQGIGYHRGLAGIVKPTRDSDCSEEDQKKTMRVMDHPDAAGDKLIRGDPDGCGLDLSSQRYSPSSELRVDLPAEDLLNIKKGWLMKQGLNKEFNKHWFVLRGTALMYYRDPSAENKGILDGVLDLSGVRNVSEIQVVRNYGFQTMSWDECQYVLSAVTAGIRNNWMSAIRRAAGLQEPNVHDGSALSIGEKLEHELDTTQVLVVCSEREPSIVPSTPLTPRSVLFSSDEEYRTASEGGRRESEDWTEPLTPLPPSPPLNRTPISRVKEKARSRVYKRSRSSPPSSRRSALDSVRPDDLLLACCGEVPESDAEESTGMESVKSSLFDSADSQSTETDELKRQLRTALCDVGIAEKELMKLRHHKNEMAVMEKQVKDLLASLQHTEVQLEQRTLEVVELEQLKQNYRQLLQEHEELLAQWREHTLGPDWRSLYQQVQRRYHSDSEEWQHKLNNTEAALDRTSQMCERLGQELSAEQGISQRLREEVADLQQQLSHSIDENETVYQRMLEFECQVVNTGSPSRSSSTNCGLSACRERGRSVDSLSDLTKIELEMNPNEMDRERLLEEFEELRGRFEKAVAEIQAMRRELRESHTLYDDLELTCISLRQEASSREGTHDSEASLMVSRIEDLTLKLSAADKQVRILKQKLTKSESRDKRRSLSLKGRESFQICKELEEKLGELEAKIIALAIGKPTVKQPKPISESPQKSQNENTINGETLKTSSSRLRRKSLDSATSSEPMKVLIRLSSLEAKVKRATEKLMPKDGVCYKTDVELCQSVAVNIESPRESHLEENTVEETVCVAQLEDLVIKSRDKVQECINFVSTSFRDRTSNPEGVLMHNCAILEQRLYEVKYMLQECNIHCIPLDLEVNMKSDEDNSLKNSVQCVVSQLENLLRTKLSALLAKREALRKCNILDKEAQLQLIAEKLAYETVLVQRIARSVLQSEDGTTKFRKWIMDNEILQSTRLISALKSKLNGHGQEEHHCESSVEYLTKVLVKKLLLQRKLALQNSDAVSKRSSHTTFANNTYSSIIRLLLKGQQELNDYVHSYKTVKLNELAASLASETLSYTLNESTLTNVQNEQHLSSPEDQMIREAWEMAQETVNRELIQAEISHITMRCGQLYEAQLSAEQEAIFIFMAKHRSILEQWSDAVENILRQEIESSIQELTQKYEEYVEKWKGDGSSKQRKHSDCDAEESRRLLSEFSDVIAHKALIDARISLLLQESPRNDFSNITDNCGQEDAANLLEIDSLFSDESWNLEILGGAEFEHMYQHFANECNSAIEAMGVQRSPKKSSKIEESIGIVMKSLLSIEDSLGKLWQCMESEALLNPTQKPIIVKKLEGNLKNDTDITWHSICTKCSTLQNMVDNLTQRVVEGLECQRCQQLQQAVQRLHEQHEDQIQKLKHSHAKAVSLLHSTLEQKQNDLISKHRQENEELRDKAQQLQMQLDSLDTEYNKQVATLHSLYEKTIASGSMDRFDDKNIQQRYQYEVEHLKALCEKGLIAMEKSHHRIIAEMEEKHQQELEQMQQEKDQALAEETQATLAALDAMRKAHEIEVQKEIAKFKTEFMKKVQYSKDFGALHKEHIEEIEGIKKEILSLSEKYSNKCVESATLEEQLAIAHQHIIQLDVKNKKLKAEVEYSNSFSRGKDILAPQLAYPREPSPVTFSRNPVLVSESTTTAGTVATNTSRNCELSPVQN